MHLTTYLYRAVNLDPIEVIYEYDDDGQPVSEIVPAGEYVYGRTSGYLSRSAAAAAGKASGDRYEVLKSEPIVFLTKAQRLQKQINELQAELDAHVEGTS